MPLYEYRCRKCGHHFDKVVSIDNRNDLQECPNCKAEFGKHIITPTNFHLPGHSYDYPTAADKWTREHEKAAREGKKKEEEQQKDLSSSMY